MRKQPKRVTAQAQVSEDLQPLSVRFPAKLLKRLKVFADEDRRKMAPFVRLVLEEYVDRRDGSDRETA